MVRRVRPDRGPDRGVNPELAALDQRFEDLVAESMAGGRSHEDEPVELADPSQDSAPSPALMAAVRARVGQILAEAQTEADAIVARAQRHAERLLSDVPAMTEQVMARARDEAEAILAEADARAAKARRRGAPPAQASATYDHAQEAVANTVGEARGQVAELLTRAWSTHRRLTGPR